MKSFIFFFLASSAIIYSQPFITGVSLKFSYMRTFQQYEDNPYAFSPQVELKGNIYDNYFLWGLTAGYWNDGVNEPLPVKDYETYTDGNFNIGLRIYTSLHKDTNLYLITGADYNFLKRTYLNEWVTTGKSGYYNYFQPYLGASYNYNFSSISLIAEAGFHFND